MEAVRRPAVAGRFYPADPDELRSMVARFLADGAQSVSGPAPKAIIAPHAGYIYSGSIAGTAYALLARDRAVIRRIVLLGPSHRVGFKGCAVSSASTFETPLGPIPVDTDAVARISSLACVQVLDRAHESEHSLEVHLPFLQAALDQFTLIPIAVGVAPPDDVANVLELLWGGPETRIVVSSDLSHYHDYATAVRLDEATTHAIEALRYEDITYDDACGRNPVNGLLAVARSRGMHATTLDLRNSGDTAGPRDRVVGYGAYAID